MGIEKKLKQYIKDDRPKRLKSYVTSHDVDVTDITLSRGWDLLHYCVQHGSGDMLRCLLKLDCVPDRQDKDGNLPLHLAALKGLNEQAVDSMREVLDAMIVPLLNAYPLGQDVENRDGVTGHDLVTAVKYKVKTASLGNHKVKQQEERIEAEEEEMWRQKLADEMMFEAEEQNPRYDLEEDLRTEDQIESVEDWTARISREMSKRQTQKHEFTRDKKQKHAEEKKKRKSSRWSKLDEDQQRRNRERDEERERLHNAREEMKKRYKPPPFVPNNERLAEKKRRYESKFSHLLQHLAGKTLTYGCVPWPHNDLDLISATLFCDFPDKKSSDYRKYLRTQQVRWHPDKFTQKFGQQLHPEHAKKIMNRVKNISQMLNKLAGQ